MIDDGQEPISHLNSDNDRDIGNYKTVTDIGDVYMSMIYYEAVF